MLNYCFGQKESNVLVMQVNIHVSFYNYIYPLFCKSDNCTFSHTESLSMIKICATVLYTCPYIMIL